MLAPEDGEDGGACIDSWPVPSPIDPRSRPCSPTAAVRVSMWATRRRSEFVRQASCDVLRPHARRTVPAPSPRSVPILVAAASRTRPLQAARTRSIRRARGACQASWGSHQPASRKSSGVHSRYSVLMLRSVLLLLLYCTAPALLSGNMDATLARKREMRSSEAFHHPADVPSPRPAPVQAVPASAHAEHVPPYRPRLVW